MLGSFMLSLLVIVGFPLVFSFIVRIFRKREKTQNFSLIYPAKIKIGDLVRVRIYPTLYLGPQDGRIGLVKRFFESPQGNCYSIFFTREGEERIFQEHELEKL
jgi:hypothetical protein